MSVLVRRIYEDVPSGRRVLVDRIWPRGVSKEEADLDDVRSEKLAELVAAADGKRLVLLTSTKVVDHSHATVLAELIRDRTS